MRKICVVTGSRAEYGHLYWLMKAIQKDPALKLQTVAAGMHLSKEFGSTYREFLKDGFKISAKVPIDTRSDDPVDLAKAAGAGMAGFAEAYRKLRPDIVVILGDRFELLGAAAAALFIKIPIAHIHGGERTEGVIDEAVRHSITKMASFHFTAAKDYRRRVIQLGEDPNRVFNFGAPGADHFKRTKLLSRRDFEKSIGFELGDSSVLVTYHSVTLEDDTAGQGIDNLLAALRLFDGRIIFTGSNADAHGKSINRRIRRFVARSGGRACFFMSLGHVRYLSALSHVDLMVGNSSSGLIEAPSYRLPAINIGDRQRGRVRGANVIDCGSAAAGIVRAMRKARSPTFRRAMKRASNPYDRFADGRNSVRIKDRLKKVKLTGTLLKKEFRDLR